MSMATYSNAFMTFMPPLFWLVAAFRPQERSVELTWLLSDLGWLWFLGGIAVVMPMFIVLGVAVLSDRSTHPVFPRWMGWLSFCIFVAFLPDQLLFFFKSGPFAWTGIFSFWIPLTCFCGWFLLVFWFLRRDLLQARPGTLSAAARASA